MFPMRNFEIVVHNSQDILCYIFCDIQTESENCELPAWGCTEYDFSATLPVKSASTVLINISTKKLTSLEMDTVKLI